MRTEVIYNLVESGLVDGMSFGFTCSDTLNEATGIRTITHIDELYEITITPFPAYKEASVIAKRQEAEKEQKKADEEKHQAYSGWRKFFVRRSADSRICLSRAGWSDTFLRHSATFTRIITSECPIVRNELSYLGGESLASPIVD
mgnify:CR=1 FL=1